MSVTAYIKYGGISSKTRAMYGNRLKSDDYTELAAKQSLSDVASYLKSCEGYKHIMNDTDERLIHREQLEKLLKKSLDYEYRKLYNFASDKDKQALKTYVLKNEIEFILKIIRSLRNKSDVGKAELMASLNENTETIYSPELIQLLKANNFEDFLLLLNKTRFAGALDNLKADEADSATIEHALTVHFYTLLFRKIERLFNKKDIEMLINQLGAKIDIENINRLLRLKKYFSGINVNNFILPFGKRLKAENLKKLVESNDTTETLREVCPYYSKYYDNPSIEESYECDDSILLDIDRLILRMGQPSIAIPIAYLTVKEIEIRNLFHIIEGIRYKRPAESILKSLVIK